jgi:glycosyltransferase involved in cell wall biosynthesis
MAGAPPAGLQVAYVTMRFPARSETFAATDLRALRALGVRPSVYALRRATPADREAGLLRDLEDVPVSEPGLRSIARGVARMVRVPGAVRAVLAGAVGPLRRRPAFLAKTLLLLPRAFDVAASILRDDPDAVHLFWGHYPALVGRLLQHAGYERVTLFLGAYDLSWRHPVSLAVAAEVPVVFTHARANIPELRDAGVPPEKVVVAPRGVDTEWIREVARGAHRDERVIVSAGRLIPEKRFDAVLRAFTIARERRPELRLRVFGDGPERGRLERLADELGIGNAADFAGHQPHEEVVRGFAGAGALLFLSEKPGEVLPNVVKEAMAVGCVCIVSPTRGIAELVEDGRTGTVLPSADPEAAARALEQVLADPAAASEVRTRGRRTVETRFSAAASMQEYADRWARLGAVRPEPNATTAARSQS